jgi:hypothetical protein
MNNYELEAAQTIRVDEDGLGLFCTVESEMNKDRRYELRCTESSTEVVVHNCSCKGYQYYKRCKHVGIVQAYWNRIYAPVKVVETPKVEAPVKKTRKPRTGLVRKVRNGGLVLVQAPTKVEQIATEVGVTIEQVQEIAEIAAEHNREKLEGKHTEMCLPIGPRDTKKDIARKTTDISTEGSLYSNKGFSIWR